MEYRKQQFQTYDEFSRQFPCDYSMPFARGGHGELYRGLDTETNEEVAIKRRLFSVGDEFLSLEKEFTNTQEVPPSRFIVRYLYYGRYATPFGTFEYLVMRYYRDGNLTSHRLPWHQMPDHLQRRFVDEFLRGLDHLHNHNIIHRDIKPENVLLVRYADSQTSAYRPVLADFGISKILTEHPEIARTLVQNSMRIGTVTYMAPEQIRAERITYNADLWSFGIILYEIITGKHMVPRQSFPEQQREAAYGFWRDVDGQHFPTDLDNVAEPYQQIIRACLVVDPKKRVQRAADLLTLLAQPAGPPANGSALHTGPAAGAPAAEFAALSVNGLAEPAASPSAPADQLTQQLTELLGLPPVAPKPELVVPLEPRPEPPPAKPKKLFFERFWSKPTAAPPVEAKERTAQKPPGSELTPIAPQTVGSEPVLARANPAPAAPTEQMPEPVTHPVSTRLAEREPTPAKPTTPVQSEPVDATPEEGLRVEADALMDELAPTRSDTPRAQPVDALANPPRVAEPVTNEPVEPKANSLRPSPEVLADVPETPLTESVENVLVGVAFGPSEPVEEAPVLTEEADAFVAAEVTQPPFETEPDLARSIQEASAPTDIAGDALHLDEPLEDGYVPIQNVPAGPVAVKSIGEEPIRAKPAPAESPDQTAKLLGDEPTKSVELIDNELVNVETLEDVTAAPVPAAAEPAATPTEADATTTTASPEPAITQTVRVEPEPVRSPAEAPISAPVEAPISAPVEAGLIQTGPTENELLQNQAGLVPVQAPPVEPAPALVMDNSAPTPPAVGAAEPKPSSEWSGRKIVTPKPPKRPVAWQPLLQRGRLWANQAPRTAYQYSQRLRQSERVGRLTDQLAPSHWVIRLVLAGIILVVLTISNTSSGPGLHLFQTPKEGPVVSSRPSESYRAALRRFDAQREHYQKTGRLDPYLWTFIHCNPSYEDSLVQSAIHRADVEMVLAERLFPQYKGNLPGLKRLEMKRLVLNKISWEANSHDIDDTSCLPMRK